MADEITPQQRWSTQTTIPTSPRERVRALVNSPLGSNAWANPLRMGEFTIHDFWDVRQEPDYRYKQNWPTEPLELAQLMLDTGLSADKIDIAVRVEHTNRHQGVTSALQMHRALRKGHGLSTTYKDALGALATAYEASINMDLGKGDTQGALRSHMRSSDHWVAALHSLTQYDNSPEAQNAYLAAVQKTLAPSKPKEGTPSGALPLRGRYREQPNDSTYQHGWDSTGSALVQALPQADNAALTTFLHDRHDLHGLGAMVVQQRLQLSNFLALVAAPASTPMPTVEGRYGAAPTPEEYRHASIIEVLSALTDMMPAQNIAQETQKALQANPKLADALQSLVPAPATTEDVSSWWNWNLRLHAIGLIDANNPSVRMHEHLSQLGTVLPEYPRHSSGLKFMQANDFDAKFATFSGSHPALSDMALAMLIHSIPNHVKPTEVWDRMKSSDVSWMHKADCTRYITPELLTATRHGQRDILPFAAMFLPHMKAEDQAKIAPIVAYSVGVQTIQSFSPKTLRSMWKEHNDSAFKATIPTQYAGDTYILYALTRKNADDLMSTLSSMDVRHDIPSYLQCVETWTRQAMELPPTIEDIGPTDNLFGV